MKYPTVIEVEAANHVQLARWYRFLDSPGMSAIDTPGRFQDVIEHESIIMTRIERRFNDMGGFTPEISKQIGWIER